MCYDETLVRFEDTVDVTKIDRKGRDDFCTVTEDPTYQVKYKK